VNSTRIGAGDDHSCPALVPYSTRCKVVVMVYTESLCVPFMPP
jgi:hypothetical protein